MPQSKEERRARQREATRRWQERQGERWKERRRQYWRDYYRRNRADKLAYAAARWAAATPEEKRLHADQALESKHRRLAVGTCDLCAAEEVRLRKCVECGYLFGACCAGSAGDQCDDCAPRAVGAA